MIATSIENKIRRHFYGLFWRKLNPLTTGVWKAKLTQCIERNVQFDGGRYNMPDRYLVTLMPGIIVSDEKRQVFALKIKNFIYEYENESDYKLMNDIRIDFIIKETGIDSGIAFFGWVSSSREFVTNMNAIVYCSEQKGEIIKFISLSEQNKYLIGRADKAKINLKHRYISYNHAQLIIDEIGTVHVRDLCSLNGTYLQGRRLEPHELYTLKLPSVICLGGIYEIMIRNKSEKTMYIEKCKMQNVKCKIKTLFNLT